MTRLPQPIPYQGSKRNIAHHILKYFPTTTSRIVEPFAGSAAISVAAAFFNQADYFIINDLNKPLMDLLQMIINEPKQISDAYESLWQAQLGQERAYYDFVRDEFNKHQKPEHFLYLLARCVKASVRYNLEGKFNQSPDNRRKGRRPESMRKEIYRVSNLLKERSHILSGDYKNILPLIRQDDLIYLDPPYQGTSKQKDRRYYKGINSKELIHFLEKLNQREIQYILSYDGRTGPKQHGHQLPKHLSLHHLEIEAGRSTQSTLLGGQAITYESLYLSPALTAQLALHDNTSLNTHGHQLQFNFT